MSDQIPQPTYRNLCDKLYDKRKQGALEIEQLVKEYSAAKKEEEIKSVIKTLTTDFVDSPQGNNKKGGLIALAAAVIGLGTASLIINIIIHVHPRPQSLHHFTTPLHHSTTSHFALHHPPPLRHLSRAPPLHHSTTSPLRTTPPTTHRKYHFTPPHAATQLHTLLK